MDPLIGQHLGQYQIVSKIGAGGMATVYRARQASIDRDVAIKVIRGDLTEEENFTERFQREAKTIAALSHLHILKVFDYGQHQNLVYLVMELLAGGSLSRLIRTEGPLPPARVARFLEQIGSALDYAHQQGIIHRDLKPDNVLLDKHQNAFLTDFGLAKLLNETTRITRTGTVMGTPAYMAPELWTGETADNRTDVYALGVMVYEMLTAKSPFMGDTPFRVMHMHIYEPMPSARSIVPDLPELIDPVLDKSVAKDREQRFVSAGELAAAFKAALAGIPTPPRGQTMTSMTPAQRPSHASTVLDAPRPTQQRVESQPVPTRPAKPTFTVQATYSAGQEPAAKGRRSGLLVIGAAVLLLLGVAGFLLVQTLTENRASQEQTQTAVFAQTVNALAMSTQTAVALLASTETPTQTVTPTNTPETPTYTPVPPTNTSESPTVEPSITPSSTFMPTETPTITGTPVPSVTPTITPNPETLVAQTLVPIQTATALARNVEATVQAIVRANDATSAALRTAEAQQTRDALATLQVEQSTQSAFATSAARMTRTSEAAQTLAAIRTATAESRTTTGISPGVPTLPPTPSPQPVVRCPGFLTSRLIIGEYGRITPGDPNRLRTAPSTGAFITQIPAGGIVKILDGPTCSTSASGGIAWWYVEYTTGGKTYQGWTAEGQGSKYFIEPIGPQR